MLMLKKNIYIAETESIKDVLKKLDKTAEKVLLVTDSENRLLGTISDGDIRRYLLSGKSLEDNIKKVYYKKPTFAREGEYSMDEIKGIFLKKKIEVKLLLERTLDYTHKKTI